MRSAMSFFYLKKVQIWNTLMLTLHHPVDNPNPLIKVQVPTATHLAKIKVAMQKFIYLFGFLVNKMSCSMHPWL